MAEEVKLLGGITSRFCFRIQWALKLKGVEYEYVIEDLKNKSPTLLKYNPVHKQVPVLVHNGKPVCESLVILEYIDEVWKQNPLLPPEPQERATTRFWAKFADEKVVPRLWEAFIAQGEDKEKAIELALESLSFLEKQIEGKSFFGGDEIGYLDLVVGWIAYWLNPMENVGNMKLMDSDRFPSLYKWSHNFIDTTPIRECLPTLESVFNYYNRRLLGATSN